MKTYEEIIKDKPNAVFFVNNCKDDLILGLEYELKNYINLGYKYRIPQINLCGRYANGDYKMEEQINIDKLWEKLWFDVWGEQYAT